MMQTRKWCGKTRERDGVFTCSMASNEIRKIPSNYVMQNLRAFLNSCHAGGGNMSYQPKTEPKFKQSLYDLIQIDQYYKPQTLLKELRPLHKPVVISDKFKLLR